MTDHTLVLAGYVARCLLERVASMPRLAAPEGQAATAVVLLTDIERFTALVESFSAGGREGLEELTWVLNAYFADVADTVHAHGGDILYIAGDAFLCHWRVPDEDLAASVRRASQCGLALQRRLQGREARPGTPIRTRVGIGAGQLVTAFVGGVGGRWEVVAAGEALGGAIAAEGRAAAGTVVLDPAAWGAVRHAASGARDRDGFVTLDAIGGNLSPRPLGDPPASVSDEALRPLLPPAVVDRLALPDAQWLAESRRVSVLLADLPPLSDASEASLARTHAGVRAFQEVVARCDGTIKVDVDAKGILLLAVFGLPPRAHEDDAERAALAAQLLAAALGEIGAAGGVGVATGRAICGAFGSDARRDYMVRGDAINLAARLMQAAAPGEVLCDAATVSASRGRIEFAGGRKITVKGRVEPVEVFQPLQRREAVRREGVEMIGRIAELSAIAEVLVALRDARMSGLVLIEADAGLGKSRLLAEASQVAADSGLTVLQGGADAIEQSTPYYAWRPVFMRLFNLTPGADAVAARSTVADHLGRLPGVARLAPLIGAVLPFAFEDSELTADMSGDVRAANTRLLLAAVLRDAAAAGTTVLAMEDAHWLDSASWDLLLEAVAIAPLVVLVTTRPAADPAPPQHDRLLAAAGERRLRLAGLTQDEMAALVRHRLGVAAPEQLVAFIQDRVSGHPFFAEELLQAMVERGAVSVQEGQCTVGDLDSLDLPTTVEQVIVSRLDRLTPGEQLCLKVASVVGRIFRSLLVQEAHPVADERPRVPGHLAALTTTDLISLETPEPELAYLFRHVITRDVTYETMPLAQRRPLHRAVAEWYESHHDDLSPYYGLLAYHWGQAADAARTAFYLDKAGQLALRSGGLREASVLFGQALALMDGGAIGEDRVQRALWERSLGYARYYLSDMEGAKTHLRRALAGLHKAVPQTEAGAIRGALRAAATQVLHRLKPGRYRGRRQAEHEILTHAVECYRILADTHYMVGDPPVWLVYSSMNALNVGEEAGESPSLARVLMATAMLLYIIGLTGRASHYELRAMDVVERQRDMTATAHTWALRSLLFAQQARWREAIDASLRARSLAQELGDAGMESHIWLVYSTILHCAGDFARAPDGWNGMREIAGRNGNTIMHCWSQLDEVETLLARGDVDNADRVLADALSVETPAGDALLTMEKQHAIAAVRLRQERLDEALAAADITFDYMVKTPPNGYYMADHFAVAVEVYLTALQCGHPASPERRIDIARRARRGVRLLAKYSRTFVPVRARASLLAGLLAVHQGRPARARVAFERAAAQGARTNTPFERGRALLELSRLTASDGAALRAEARQLFEASGAPYWASLAS